MSGQWGARRLALRLVVGLNRAGWSVRGAQELFVADKYSSATLRALVFPVSVDGVEYLVSTRPDARWVRSLRAARVGELRAGRRCRTFHATRADDETATRALRAFQRHVPALLSRESETWARPVAFRVVAGQASDALAPTE